MNNPWIRRIVILVGVPSLAFAGWYAYQDLSDLQSPPWWALAPAAVLNILTLLTSARSWDALLPDEVDIHQANESFYTSQLMKYSPVGGAAQAASQAALATGDEVSIAKATTAMVVSKLTVVIAGGVFGPILAVSNPELAGWFRILLLFTPLSLLLGHPYFLQRAVEITAKVLRKDPDHTILPSPAGVWRSIAWSTLSLATTGATFALLAVASGLGENPVQAAAGFVLAWVIGFLVIPIPAGLGIREAAIAFLVAGDPASKLVAAVLFRVVVVTTEALMVGFIRLRRRITGPDAPEGLEVPPEDVP